MVELVNKRSIRCQEGKRFEGEMGPFALYYHCESNTCWRIW